MIRKFFPLAFLFFLVFPVHAQNAALSDFAKSWKKWERLEGTIEQTQNGVTSRARLSFQAPDSLRLEIEANEPAQIKAQTIVASGNETRIYEPLTKRLQRLPYNIARQWWRGWDLRVGGPANVLLFGITSEDLDRLYTPQSTARTLTLEARPNVEARFINDYVRFGGSGDRIFYAPLKRWVWNRAEKISLENKNVTQFIRTETRDGQTLITTVSPASGLTQTARVTDDKHRVVADFKYNLKARPDDFPANTFALDLAPGQILEDLELNPLAEYSGADANHKFNLGVALWKHAEEIPAALAAWDEAAKLAPQATAPPLAIYELSLSSRDPARAEIALGKISELIGNDSPEVHWRRAALAVQRRDWAAAQTAFESAIKLQPQNLALKVSLADVLRSRGEYSAARDLLLEAIKTENPQASAAQAEAALMLGALSWNDNDAILKLLPETTAANLWQKIARAQVLALQGKSSETIETNNLVALSTLALIEERLTRDTQAAAAWEKIVELAPAPLARNARLHLLALYARRGEVAPSLLQYRELSATTPGLQARSELQSTLIGAWRKAFRQSQLRGALEQRALSTTASEDDARLWLIFQDQFGTAEDVTAAIQNGLARFPRSAWWRAQRAEGIMAQVPKTPETGVRDRLQRDALDYATQAATLDPNQPYYAIQRALILTQRATPVTGVIEQGRLDPLRKLAFEALDEMLKKWPNDPDVQLAVVTQRLALEEKNQHDATIQLLQTALRGGTPNETDRHFISFSARQVLASALRDAGRTDEARLQYQNLFRAARTSSEQLGVALNFTRWLLNLKNEAYLATALVLFARENWSFDNSQQLLQPLVNVVASKSELWPGVLAELRKGNDPHARYVAALLATATYRRAKAIADQPEAPLRADRDLFAAQQTLATALTDVEPLIEGNDRVLAARVAGLLGEQAINREDAAEALAAAETFFRRAVALEPRDVNVRAALVASQIAQKKITQALQTRDDLVRSLPHSFEVLQRAARISDRLAASVDEERTARLAAFALNAGGTSAEVSPGDYQLAALLSARTALYAGKSVFATRIYNGLANDQWGKIDRAVALIDWEEALRSLEQKEQADQIAARLTTLALTPQERNIAETSWNNLLTSSS